MENRRPARKPYTNSESAGRKFRTGPAREERSYGRNEKSTERRNPKDPEHPGKEKGFSRSNPGNQEYRRKETGSSRVNPKNPEHIRKEKGSTRGKPKNRELIRKEKGSSRGNPKNPELIRLNRYIANSGVCSRRDADEHIRNGLVTVNGKVVTDLGTKVLYSDDVRFRNRKLSAEKKVYILMNKPKDYVTTVEDPHAEHTVLDLLGDACPERVYPVGRLDKATTGVLLLTNDGDLAGKLTHPKYKRRKIYHVFLDKDVARNDLFKLTEGIELDGETIVVDAISYADPEDKSQLGIELHSGQNRVIRRMFELLGYRVKKLDRVYFAGLTKKNVPRGKWRFLTDKEVSMLKRGIF